MTDRAPKKIWLRWGRKVSLLPGQISIKADGDIPYIRADIVDELVNALNLALPHLLKDTSSHGKANYWTAKDALAKARGESHD